MPSVTVKEDSITIHLVSGDGLREVDLLGMRGEKKVVEIIRCEGNCCAFAKETVSDQDDIRPRMARREYGKVVFGCDGRRRDSRSDNGEPYCDVYPVE